MELQENEFGAVDMLVDYIKQMQRSETKIIDPVRIASVARAMAILDRAFVEDGNGARADVRFDPLFSIATVSAEAEDLVFSDPRAFCSAIADSDNFEVYPLANGKIQISIMFYHAFRSI